MKLPHRFKTDHNHYSRYYDEETKNKIHEIWGIDAEVFDYEFE